jgi:hypothetical protein
MKDLEYVLNDFKENQNLDYINWLNIMLTNWKEDEGMIDIFQTWTPKIYKKYLI